MPGRSSLARTAMIALFLLSGCGTPPQHSEPQRPEPTYASAETASAEPAAATATGPVSLKPTAPEQYVVQNGDTLWDLSGLFLQAPWQWPELWQANPHIHNPHLIYPGDILTLSFADGRPVLRVTDGPRVTGHPGYVRMAPRVRVEVIESEDHAIPIRAIRDLIFQPHVVTREQLDTAPYIIGGEDYRLIYAGGDIVYLRDLDTELETFSVVRPGVALRDHRTGALLGYATDPVGVVRVLSRGEPATGQLLDVKREALPGDRLLPAQVTHHSGDFIPHAPEADVEGAVIHLFDAISMIGRLQIAVIDRGLNDGINRGTVLTTVKTGPVVHDPRAGWSRDPKVQLPDEMAATVMVFSAFENLSYALVMNAIRPVELGDIVRSPATPARSDFTQGSGVTGDEA